MKSKLKNEGKKLKTYIQNQKDNGQFNACWVKY